MSRKARKLLEAISDFSDDEITRVKAILVDDELRILRAEFEESFEELKERLSKRIISANRRVNLAENRIKKMRKIRGRKR